MTMKDDRLKDIFEEFHPELSPDQRFMSDLQRNMDAVEFVRQQTVVLKRRNRIAVLASWMAGFAAGVVSIILFQMLSTAIPQLVITMPRLSISPIVVDWAIVGWIVSAGACILTAMGVYESFRSGLRIKA